jgi:hypothetical protein
LRQWPCFHSPRAICGRAKSPYVRPETRDARHSDGRLELVSIPHPAAIGPPATPRKQMKMSNIRELSADELRAVSGGSPNLSVPAHTFDKLFAAIDKNLEAVKQLKPGYLPPG